MDIVIVANWHQRVTHLFDVVANFRMSSCYTRRTRPQGLNDRHFGLYSPQTCGTQVTNMRRLI